MICIYLFAWGRYNRRHKCARVSTLTDPLSVQGGRYYRRPKYLRV
nr:MAG TPA: hypothetical protein [Caudoviricetes sp.]